jgi:hypothetical protein
MFDLAGLHVPKDNISRQYLHFFYDHADSLALAYASSISGITV